MPKLSKCECGVHIKALTLRLVNVSLAVRAPLAFCCVALFTISGL